MDFAAQSYSPMSRQMEPALQDVKPHTCWPPCE